MKESDGKILSYLTRAIKLLQSHPHFMGHSQSEANIIEIAKMVQSQDLWEEETEEQS